MYEKMFIHQFDGVVTVSMAVLKHWVGESFKKKVSFIPQGINPIKYQNRVISENFLLFVGRLDFVQKGLDILLASLKLISDLQIPLVIVGGGDQKRLAALISKYEVNDLVIYKGRVSHEETINFFAQSYFLCLPSRYEGWPLVCVESYAFGKPVLGTDIPGLRDVVIPGETGILVPCDNSVA
jgi:glycosyltransferase involved in cell wall biosynthesis